MSSLRALFWNSFALATILSACQSGYYGATSPDEPDNRGGGGNANEPSVDSRGGAAHGATWPRVIEGSKVRSRLSGPIVLKHPGQRELGDTCEPQLQLPAFETSVHYSKFLQEFSAAAGDPLLSPSAADDGVLAAFLLQPSVHVGGVLNLKIQSTTPEWVLVEVLRMDGTKSGTTVVCGFQVHAGVQPSEQWLPIGDQRYVSFANWSDSATIKISDSQHWLSGSYVVRITNAVGATKLLPFVVEDDTLPARALVVMPSLTQPVAYNLSLSNRDTSVSAYKGWDGMSYVDAKRAKAFAVQRPLDNNSSWTYIPSVLSAVKYLERAGIPVAYTTDLGVWRRPELTRRYQTIIMPFHPEYIPPEVYASVKAAINAGVHLVSWFSNGFYWKVGVVEPDNGDTVLTINKDGDHDLWRNQLDPSGQRMSEQEFLYAEYPDRKGAWGGPATPLIISPRSSPTSQPTAALLNHWIFAGTGFRMGDTIPDMMAGEVDDVEPTQLLPPTRDAILFLSPYKNKGGADYTAATVFFTRPSGQMTFHGGSQAFANGLAADGPNQDKLRRLMNNILVRMVGPKAVYDPPEPVHH